jgi:hypothetical protein
VEGAWWNSNTYVNMFRSCGGRFDELLDPKYKGYFSGNGCFLGLKKHIEEKGIDLSSVASAYFSERRESTSFEASVLSCFDAGFVSEAGMASALQGKTSVCAAREDMEIEKLMGHLSDALLAEAWGAFDRAMGAYNENLSDQHAILPESSEDFVRDHLSRGEAEKLARLEAEGEKRAASMIAAERALFQRYYELEPAAFAGCRQGACGVKR